MFTEQTVAELPKNDIIIVYDYFIACMFYIQPNAIVLQPQQAQQVMVKPYSAILRRNTEIQLEDWNDLQAYLCAMFQQENRELKVSGVLIQQLNPISTSTKTVKEFTPQELNNRNFITPDGKLDNNVVFKDDNNDKTIS